MNRAPRTGLGGGARIGRDPAGAEARLLELLDDTFAVAARRSGEALICRPGCSDCCHGPFPISALDATRLRAGLGELAARDRAAATAIVARARQAVSVLTEGFPGDSRTGRPVADEDRLDRFFEAHAGLPCPALDPENGECALYDHRPVACRTYGPPLSFAGRPSPPCPLCFNDASDEQIERARVAPDPEGLEQALLDRLAEGESEPWFTLIAWVLAGS